MGRLRTARGKALLLAVVVALLTGSAALALSSGAEPAKSVSVYDVNGRLVGHVLETRGPYAVVVVRVGDSQAFLTVSGDQFVPDSVANTFASTLEYESGDCSGDAFSAGVVSDPTDLIPVVVLNGTKLYSPGPGDAGRTIQVRSVLHPDGLCEPAEFEEFASPAALLVDLAVEFRPPFHLRVK
jgi:hypothetical protein